MNHILSDPWYLFDEDSQENATMNAPEIKPITGLTSHRQGALYDITTREIEAVLGFPPNIDDDPDKVTVSWAFEMNGNQCAIWDWKGSLNSGVVSTFGSNEVFEELFGDKYISDIARFSKYTPIAHNRKG